MTPETLNELFKKSTFRHYNKTALIFFDRKITYGELWYSVLYFSAFLRGKNITKDGRIALLLPNCPQFVIAYFGALRAGCTVVALNPLLNSEEIAVMIENTKPEILVTLKDFSEHNYFICKNLKMSEKMVIVSLADYLPIPLKIAYWLKNILNFKPRKSLSWKVIKKTLIQWIPKVKPNNLAVLQFTGGTTGGKKRIPKAVILTHSNLVSNTFQSISHVNKGAEIINRDSVFLGVIPFFHVYGLSVCLNMALAMGSKVILLPRFKGKDVFKAIKKHKVTIFPGIPIMLEKLVQYAEEHPGDYGEICESLKLCFSGAGRLRKKIKDRFEELTNSTIIEGYGLSEASPIVSVNPVKGSKQGSLGTIVPNTEIKIVDGELWVRGPQVMKGYWNDKAATEQVLKDGNWLATGDMVSLDDDGFLWIKDRKKNMSKKKGENIYWQEIEDVIAVNSEVGDVAVVGLVKEDDDDKIIACIVLKENSQLTPRDIIKYCRDSVLRSIKIPDEIKFIDKIPKTIIGKIRHDELKEIITKSPLE